MTFGEILRKYRERNDISLRELADHMGWTSPYVGDIERGRRNPPSFDQIEKMAKFVKAPTTKLLEAAVRYRKEIVLDAPSKEKAEAAVLLMNYWNSLNDRTAKLFADTLIIDEGRFLANSGGPM